MPQDSRRGRAYNPLMPKIDRLVKAMEPIARAHGVDVAQIPVAWAIARGTIPIVGATAPGQVTDAAAASCSLTDEERSVLERAARETGVDTRGDWERPMV